MAEVKKRLTARKVRIADVSKGAYKPASGMVSGYVITPYGMKVSRARIMATIVAKFVSEDKNFASATLDDGTETMRAKAFGSTRFFDSVEIGDMVDIIGKIKEYADEIYVTPEIVVKITDPNFESLRRLELIKQHADWKKKIAVITESLEKEGTPDKVAEAVKNEINAEDVESILEFLSGPAPVEEKKDDKDVAKSTVLAIITELDKGEGVTYSELMTKANVDEKTFDKVVNDLLEEGTCYEPKPGQLKKC
ncbi:MAG: OB-fold nucleic acid binding domain-containing protein [Candidatus Aenigmatarchaeota archaeon]